MNKIGTLQRRWSELKPSSYDKESRMVRMDIQPEKRLVGTGYEQEAVDGYSYVEVQIDRHIDYGHIKSQLIEAGFAQKDEFGLVMNAVESIVRAVNDATTFAKFKENLSCDDITAFSDFCEFRKMCAEAAKEVMNHY